jgi:hypothetical protein
LDAEQYGEKRRREAKREMGRLFHEELGSIPVNDRLSIDAH